MVRNYTSKGKINDPVISALYLNNCRMRSYQADALRTIFDAAVNRRGGRYAVMFPRQSGKNETQAQLEAALMAAFGEAERQRTVVLPQLT